MQENIFEINGFKIYHKKIPNSGIVFSGFFLNKGSLSEEDGNYPDGVAHFVEHLLCKGTKTFPTLDGIYAKIDSFGCVKNAYTTEFSTCFYTSVLKENYKNGLTYTYEQFADPVLSKNVFLNEKKIIIEEAQKYTNRPEIIARQMHLKELYNSKRINNFILGNIDSINTIQYEDVVSFYKKNYILGNVIFVVVGDIDINDIEIFFKEKSRAGGSLTTSILEQKIKQPPTQYLVEDTTTRNNCSVSISYKIPSCNMDNIAYFVAPRFVTASSSFGMKKMRHENGFVYAIGYSFYENFLMFTFETSTEKLSDAIQAFLSVIKDISTGSLSDLDMVRFVEQEKYNQLTKKSNVLSVGLESLSVLSKTRDLISVDVYQDAILNTTKIKIEDSFSDFAKQTPYVHIVKPKN